MKKAKFGLYGLAVMGQNLALNIERNGFPLAVFNRTGEKTKRFVEEKASGKEILATYSLPEFTDSLERPRRIMIMVQAGPAVDSVIEQLRPHLSPGDVLIDGGNSFFLDTERRQRELEKEGIRLIGTGVSGGETGALMGPCIMPGGAREAYDEVASILTKIAARTDDGPCCTYIGKAGAGHYVKMVHNGIEYGIMQLIAEVYDIMKTGLGFEVPEMQEAFASWNEEDLGGYLMEITAHIFERMDEETRQPLVELILDEAKQKGTGKWASQNAFDLGVPIPTITAAVEARILSGYKEERVAASKILKGSRRKFRGNRERIKKMLRDALYGSIITTYAQGMALLRRASTEYGYDLDLSEIARIWKGGCIIRAKLLDAIKKAFAGKKDLPNLMVERRFARLLRRLQANWRGAVGKAVALGISCPALSASMAYYDGYRRERLPANLIQAQRDYFGAHTYRRIDREGSFHTEWEK